MSRFTKEILLEQLRKYYEKHKETPRQPNKETSELAYYKRFTYYFGSWKLALIAAGIPLHYECHESIHTFCSYCNKPVIIQYSRFQKSKKAFCCKSHAGKYNSTHNIKHRTYRSKLEIYVYNKLIEEFPNLEILHNNKSIGYELDLYVPKLNLAFEINGPIHYKAIFGEDFLKRKQDIDKLKAEKCKFLNISLIIIDVSKQTRVIPQTCEPFYQYIKSQIIKLSNELTQSSALL